MLENGLLILGSIVFVSLQITLIVLMKKYIQGINISLKEMTRTFGQLHEELKGLKPQLLIDEKSSIPSFVQDETPSKPENEKKLKISQRKLQNIDSSISQDNSGNIPIYRNLTEDEIPDNLQRLNILGAEQVVNGKPIKINTQKITVGKSGETVRVNLHMDTQNNGNK